MKNDFWDTSPSSRFHEFIAPGADRFSVLHSLLEELKLDFSLASLAGGRHFLAGPAGGGALDRPGLTVLVAHYDRVPGSPGANDNSAAVFQLAEAARRLKEDGAKNWLVIFTDKEEIGKGGGVQDQGSYALARGLKKLGLKSAGLFIFDACGTGDTIVISTTVDHLLREKEGKGFAGTRSAAGRLKTRALERARRLGLEKVLLVPTPFSDDAGFLSAGIPAQTITVLPAEEASRLAQALRVKPGLADGLVKRQRPSAEFSALLPATWKRLNGPGDREDFLTPKNYPQLVAFARALSLD